MIDIKTTVIKIQTLSGLVDRLKKPTEALKQGRLVAFPTETVYGLGADGLNAEAVAQIFKAKGRPQDNPVILHIADKKDLLPLVNTIPPQADLLINAFWPGPLTIIFKKSALVPDIITSGLDSVAIRMPSHPVALALIKGAGSPLAAPSANLSGKPSPTAATHVLQDLEGKVDFIIDGGPTDIGLESTVIDLTSEPPVLMRPGGVTKESIEAVIGSVVLPAKTDQTGAVKSPGMKYKHYAPKARVILVEGAEASARIQTQADTFKAQSLKVGLLVADKNYAYRADVIEYLGDDNSALAHKLFGLLRDFDQAGVDVILIEGVESTGLGAAIMNRIRKASETSDD
jgi:L-threonylcarbamoyladenylate synthase